MKVGIIGLSQVGKTTLLEALSGAHGAQGHGGAGVALAIVKVPDARMAELVRIYNPDEVMFATIEFEDISGVGSGEKGSAAALAAARDVDVLVVLVRAFESSWVPAPLDRVDPAAELASIHDELLLADLQIIENRQANIQKGLRKVGDHDALGREQALLERCQKAIEQQQGLASLQMTDAEQKMLRSYAFLTLKPCVAVANVGEDDAANPPAMSEGVALSLCVSLEKELQELDEEDRAEFMADAGLTELAAGRLIRACFDAAGLNTFFTAGPNQTRSWIVEVGASAPQAAGKVHTDMEKGFIRAEVVAYDDLLEADSFKAARAAGKVRMEGKTYIVQDGDVVLFHFSR